MKELSKTYEPGEYEAKIYQTWEQSGYFNPDNLKASGEPFCISLPPPNATGTLHLGHATMLAIQDLLIRFARLNGKNTLWLPGTDHAAIATQNVVEKKLYKEEGKTRFDYGREELVRRINDFVAESKNTIRQQMRAMGASCDWSRERYTLDEGLSQAVREVFTRMYNDGLIYRGTRIVNWCYRCGTTLADDEVEYKEQLTKFYYLKYGPIIIGTARPETKVLDKVIIVHPDDERYRQYVGREFDVPWIDGMVHAQVIADPVADKETGSGAMTITPAHSFIDFELAQKYGLEVVQLIGPDGKMTVKAGKFAGLNVKEARQKIVEELQIKGLLDKVEDNYRHNLSVCYRCGTPVEPMPSKQWFVAVDKEFKSITGQVTTLKRLASAAVADGQIKIIPERFDKVYQQWMANLHDWCISRQIWFGHRVPVWYCGSTASSSKRIGWAADVVSQVLKGKTCTYRLHDHNLFVGERVIFEDSSSHKVFGYGKIIEVDKIKVRDIDLQDKNNYTLYDKRAELIADLINRNPGSLVDEDTWVWRYVYEFDSRLPSKDCGAIIVSSERPAVCSSCGSTNLQQDPDTLDTWFSSGLWTFSTLGWPKLTDDFKTFHPTSVMETGYDILFFWVARMVIMSEYALGQLPFKIVYLHGLVRDKQGRKMSKSLGNGIDPLAMINKYGADALRLSMIVGTTPGNDFRLYEEKISGYRNFINKLWNISRYILMTKSEVTIQPAIPAVLTVADRWILSRFNKISSLVTNKIESFEFSAAAEALYDFTWHELADWYVEVAKVEGNKGDLLSYLLIQLLKLWHPFAPFVTETLWQQAFGQSAGLLMTQAWPKLLPPVDELAEAEFKKVQDLVVALRNYRAINKILPTEVVACFIKQGQLSEQESRLIESLRTRIKFVDAPIGDGIDLTVGDRFILSLVKPSPSY